ncbi:MAG: hypothetical protein RJQ05_00955 [Cytophagales bacterium]
MVKLMKSFIYFFIIVIISSSSLLAQKQHNFKLTSGFGYYDPEIGGDKANYFYSNISYQLPNKLFIGFEFGSSLVFRKHDGLLLESNRSKRNYEHWYLYNLTFQKEFIPKHNKKHTFYVGSGILFEQKKFSDISIFLRLVEPPDEYEIVEIVSLNDNGFSNDLGLILSGGYSYRFISKLELGLRLRTNLLYETGYGGFIISPFISLKF